MINTSSIHCDLSSIFTDYRFEVPIVSGTILAVASDDGSRVINRGDGGLQVLCRWT